jgi:hypothetical protein
MATASDAAAFRDFWNSERILEFNGKWIAFREGRVLSANEDLEFLYERFRGDISEGRSPIFALVDDEPRQ